MVFQSFKSAMAKKLTANLTKNDFPSHSTDRSLAQAQIEQRLDDWLRVTRHSVAENTMKAYKRDWEIFASWCFEAKNSKTQLPIQSLPASTETIIQFIKSQIGFRAPSSLRRCLSTISMIHNAAAVINPMQDSLVISAKKEIGRGLRDEFKDRPHHNYAGKQRQAKGITWSHLLRIKELLKVDPLINPSGLSVIKAKTARRQNGISLKNARDRALIFFGYDTLLRASELIAVKVEDIDFESSGSAIIAISKRKDSQEGEIANAYVAPDTVKEINRWMLFSGINSGPLFCAVTKSGVLRLDKEYGNPKPLTRQNVADIYKAVADKIGESSDLFSCHSTRVGATQDMLEENIGMLAVKQAGRWKSDRMPSQYAKKVDAKRGGMAQLSMKKNRC